jgi:hypothetical protein
MMPVRKFRTVEEMNRPVWRTPGSAELLEAIRNVWEFGRRTSRRRFRPGVYRYRSIEEMQKALETITIDPRS